jgi:membrane protein implicated in regulation of membrane protease activity
MTVPVTTTTTTTTKVEQRTHWIERGLVWTLAPFVDNWTGLSLNRFLAVMFGVSAVWPVYRTPSLPISWQGVALAVISGSLAWGKDVFLAYINRKKDDEK